MVDQAELRLTETRQKCSHITYRAAGFVWWGGNDVTYRINQYNKNVIWQWLDHKVLVEVCLFMLRSAGTLNFVSTPLLPGADCYTWK